MTANVSVTSMKFEVLKKKWPPNVTSLFSKTTICAIFRLTILIHSIQQSCKIVHAATSNRSSPIRQNGIHLTTNIHRVHDNNSSSKILAQHDTVIQNVTFIDDNKLLKRKQRSRTLTSSSSQNLNHWNQTTKKVEKILLPHYTLESQMMDDEYVDDENNLIDEVEKNMQEFISEKLLGALTLYMDDTKTSDKIKITDITIILTQIISNNNNDRGLSSTLHRQFEESKEHNKKLRRKAYERRKEILYFLVTGVITYTYYPEHYPLAQTRHLVNNIEIYAAEYLKEIITENSLVSLPQLSLVFSNSSQTTTEEKTNNNNEDDDSKDEMTKILSITFGFLLIAIGVFGIFVWMYIFYARYENMKILKEEEKKNSPATTPPKKVKGKVIDSPVCEKATFDFKPKFSNLCSRHVEQYTIHSRSEGGASTTGEDSFARRLQSAVIFDKRRKDDNNSSSQRREMAQRRWMQHNENFIAANDSFTEVEEGGGSEPFALPVPEHDSNIGDSRRIRMNRSLPTNNGLVTSNNMPDTTDDKDTIPSDPGLMLAGDNSTSSSETNKTELPYEFDGIEVSLEEIKFNGYTEMEDDNSNIGVEDVFLNLEHQESERYDYILDDEYTAAVSAAAAAVRESRLNMKINKSNNNKPQQSQDLNQTNQTKESKLNKHLLRDEAARQNNLRADSPNGIIHNFSYSSDRDDQSSKGDSSLIQAFNVLNDVSKFIQKYEKKRDTMSENNTSQAISRNHEKNVDDDFIDNDKSIDSNDNHKSYGIRKKIHENESGKLGKRVHGHSKHTHKKKLFEDEWSQSTDEGKSHSMDYSLALDEALRVTETVKVVQYSEQSTNALRTSERITSTNNNENMTQLHSLKNTSSKNKDDSGKFKQEDDSEMENQGNTFSSLFAKRLGISPYVPKNKITSNNPARAQSETSTRAQIDEPNQQNYDDKVEVTKGKRNLSNIKSFESKSGRNFETNPPEYYSFPKKDGGDMEDLKFMQSTKLGREFEANPTTSHSRSIGSDKDSIRNKVLQSKLAGSFETNPAKNSDRQTHSPSKSKTRLKQSFSQSLSRKDQVSKGKDIDSIEAIPDSQNHSVGFETNPTVDLPISPSALSSGSMSRRSKLHLKFQQRNISSPRKSLDNNNKEEKIENRNLSPRKSSLVQSKYSPSKFTSGQTGRHHHSASRSDVDSDTGAKSLISMFESNRSPNSEAIFPPSVHWQYDAGKGKKNNQ